MPDRHPSGDWKSKSKPVVLLRNSGVINEKQEATLPPKGGGFTDPLRGTLNPRMHAWEAAVLPLNYTRNRRNSSAVSNDVGGLNLKVATVMGKLFDNFEYRYAVLTDNSLKTSMSAVFPKVI